MCSRNSAWQATAAYLYVLGLDSPGVAWEYMRRNAAYVHQWRRWVRLRRGKAARWGLLAFCDPAADARAAVPLWQSCAGVPRLVASGEGETSEAVELRLWGRSGPRLLAGHGHELAGSFASGRLTVRFEADVGNAVALAFVIPAGSQAGRYWHAALRANAHMSRHVASAQPTAVHRERLLDLRGLQALDGLAANALHREIASVLFGADCVAHAWSADGQLRALTRYCIRRARDLVNGGYRQLLDEGRRKPRVADLP